MPLTRPLVRILAAVAILAVAAIAVLWLGARTGFARNLAADRIANPTLVMAMSDKLEAVIQAEIGVDDGREMPEMGGIRWAIDSLDL